MSERVPMGELGVMAMFSLKLQEMLQGHGFRKGSGVSTAGIELVSAVARERGLRDWKDTQTPDDYRALIAAVRERLGGNPPAGNTAGREEGA
jgi:hypothetical protein